MLQYAAELAANWLQRISRTVDSKTLRNFIVTELVQSHEAQVHDALTIHDRQSRVKYVRPRRFRQSHATRFIDILSLGYMSCPVVSAYTFVICVMRALLLFVITTTTVDSSSTLLSRGIRLTKCPLQL